MFQNGELVIYGAEGVCRMERIETMKVGGVRREYFVLKPIYRAAATVYVPVESEALRPKMRRLLSAQELDEMILKITQEDPLWIEDNNQRKAEFQQTLADGERSGLMRMIRSIYLHRLQLREKGKHLRSSDEQFLRDAERLLNDEFAVVLELSPSEVPEYIRKKLEPDAQSVENGG